MKKYWKEISLATIFAVIIVPLIIALVMSVRLICTDTSNEWIGFWGSYIGAILSAGIAIYVMKETIKIESEIRDVEESGRFLNTLIEKSTAITKNNKYMMAEVKFEKEESVIIKYHNDKQTFLEKCVELNQSLDEFSLFLLIAAQTSKYKNIENVQEAFSDYSEVCGRIVNTLSGAKAGDEESIYNNIKIMNAVQIDFNKAVKDFIIINTINKGKSS